MKTKEVKKVSESQSSALKRYLDTHALKRVWVTGNLVSLLKSGQFGDTLEESSNSVVSHLKAFGLYKEGV